jgi:CHAT domain-containing protein/tetratricopeptide (TPR) repeat protein
MNQSFLLTIRWYVLTAFLLVVTRGWGQEGALSALLRTGDELIGQEAYLEAKPYFEQALPLAAAGDDPIDHFRVLFWLGEIYYVAGDYYGALRVSERADSLAVVDSLTEQVPNYAQLLVNLGVFYSVLGDLDKSLKAYQRSFAFARSHYGRESEEVVSAYFSLGAVHKNLGQIQRSIAYTDTAAQIAHLIDYRNMEAAAYNNLAYIYGELNDLSKAIAYEERAMEFVESKLDSAIYLNNLGTFLMEVGRHEDAVNALEKALALRQKNYPPGHPLTGSTTLNLASVHYLMEDYQETLRLVREVQRTADLSLPGNVYNIQLALIHEGSVLIEQGQYAQGEAKARTSLNLDEAQGMASSYYVLANALLKQKKLLRSLEAIQKGIAADVPKFSPTSLFDLPDPDQVVTFPVLIDLLVCKTQILKEFAGVERTEEYLVQAYETADFLDRLVSRARLFKKDYVSREFLAADLRDFYSLAVETCVDLYELTGEEAYFEKAYYYTAKNKALQISERLSQQAIDTLASVDPQLVDRERQLKSQIDFFANKLRYRAYFAPEQVRAWDQRMLALQREREQLLDRLQQEAPAYFDLVHQNSIATVAELQQNLLGDNEILLEYFVTSGDHLFLFVLSQEKAGVYRLPVPEDLEGVVRRLREAIVQQDPGFYDQSRQLYQWLLGPIRETLPPGSKLIIIPDGVLGLLPFELLIGPEDPTVDRAPYLLQKFPIRYLFSGRQGIESDRPRVFQANGKVLAMAPDFSKGIVRPATVRGMDSVYLPALRGNRREILDVRKRYRGYFLAGRQASKKSLERANGYSVLHISTHAVIDDQFPAFSHLLFHGGDSAGYAALFAYELLEQEISTDLVILSACNTGSGRILKGQGVASMARAFAYAGSPDQIITLWPVRDETTPDLMNYLYQNLEAGMSKAEALRQAKISFLSDHHGVFSHPYYWAPFVYVGDSNPLELKRRRPWHHFGMVIGLGMAVFMAGLIIWQRTTSRPT